MLRKVLSTIPPRTQGSLLHIFNPQNDLCLANGTANFIPPVAALKLSASGEGLPMWYGNRGDKFYGSVNQKWFEEVSRKFDIDLEPTQEPGVECCVQPWGWSLSLRRTLVNSGFSADRLPTVEDIEKMRALSSRATGVPLLKKIIDILPSKETVSGPVVCRDVTAALKEIDKIGVAIVKLPWSGSGRGQQVTDRTTPDELIRRIGGMLKHQSAVEIAPFYNRLMDFALLFDGERFAGFSLFETDTHGGWVRNILLPDKMIENRIIEALGFDPDFKTIIKRISRLVGEHATRFDYAGLSGVDFIVATGENDNRFLVPVEINWRRTMGHVSHRLAERFLAPDCTGVFRIVQSDKETSSFHSPEKALVEGNRIVRGSLDLVPAGGAFRFIVDVSDEKM